METSSSLTLHPATLLASISVLGFLLAGVSFSISKTLAGQRFGLLEWSKAMCAVGGSFLLFYVRGHAPWFLTYLVANALVMAVGPYAVLAHARLFEIAVPRLVIAIVAAFGMSGALAAFFLDAPRQVARFTLGSAVAISLGMIAVMIFRNIDRKSSPSAWISCVVVALTAAAWAMRAVLSVFGETPLVEATPLSLGSSVAGVVFTVATSIGFFSMVNERHQRETLASLRRDELTGLFTRATFFEKAGEIDKMNAPNTYAVVMVDIDHFKAVNDAYGHAGGDTTLAHAGRLIANSVRSSDIAGRYGGEEFCILLRGCSETEAAQFATRLVTQAEQQTVRLGDGRNVRFTLSAGYACRSTSSRAERGPETISDVIERADQALYRAKRRGRNQALPAAPSDLASAALA
ncbi:diguanylate cyclase [Rhodoferax sp.]|uniref:GGDEF domain-containing protein n=1 Tax=Rhodoferax sp. TaxID=50421 RepID=UPI002726E93E|nr:GGDEF domain-containing protein [Rhodoferax sp.]MDO9196092.1 GGDEF domain-containing protein [Rhodoferax sp.]